MREPNEALYDRQGKSKYTPLIERWLSEGKYTCSIPEFAKLYGIKTDRARELCNSATPPPGFYSGRRYHILVSGLEEYMKDLARRKKTIDL